MHGNMQTMATAVLAKPWHPANISDCCHIAQATQLATQVSTPHAPTDVRVLQQALKTQYQQKELVI